MNLLGRFHFGIAVLAMLVGAVVVLRRKGTPPHRWIGRLYVLSMVALNLTALSIYRLYGTFGPFHVLALFSLVTVLFGLSVVLQKKTQSWMAIHAEVMAWSYVGLLAAAVAEVSVRVLHAPFNRTVIISSLAVMLVGATIIQLKVRPLRKQIQPPKP